MVKTKQEEEVKQTLHRQVTPRAVKVLHSQGRVTNSSQKSLKAQMTGEIAEHSMIVDTGLASHDFLGEDADLLINMSFGGLENQ